MKTNLDHGGGQGDQVTLSNQLISFALLTGPVLPALMSESFRIKAP